MRVGRLENDDRWNYGVSLQRCMERKEGYEFRLWLFRNDEFPTEHDGFVQIGRRGFMFSLLLAPANRCFVIRPWRIWTRIM